jgi:hypothetical protein
MHKTYHLSALCYYRHYFLLRGFLRAFVRLPSTFKRIQVPLANFLQSFRDNSIVSFSHFRIPHQSDLSLLRTLKCLSPHFSVRGRSIFWPLTMPFRITNLGSWSGCSSRFLRLSYRIMAQLYILYQEPIDCSVSPLPED